MKKRTGRGRFSNAPKQSTVRRERASDSQLAISAIETAKKAEAVKAEEEKTQAMIEAVYAVA